MSTRNEQLREVIELACLTENRSDGEQRALMGWAWDCDREHNRDTVSNRARRDPKFELWDLVTLVDTTRDEEEGDHVIAKPKNWEKAWGNWSEAGR